MKFRTPVLLAALGISAGGIALTATARGPEAVAQSNCAVAHDALEPNEVEALALINAERALVGSAPLLPSSTLNRAAAWMSEDVASNNYFSHTDSLGRPFNVRFNDCGHSGGYIGENLGMGSSSAAAIVQGWMGSPGHKAAMLDPVYKYAGLGYYQGVWTLDLASVSSDGNPLPTVPTLTSTATATATPTATPTVTPLPSPSPSPRALPFQGRAIAALVVVE